jgi:hypothetical protein
MRERNSPGLGGQVAHDFLTARQIESYGGFGGAPSNEELERFFYLDDEDRKLIARRRDDSTRLGLWAAARFPDSRLIAI